MTGGPAVMLCTLGGSWLVVPEILGYLDPERFRVFPEKWWHGRGHPKAPPLAEVWVATTLGKPEGVERLQAYWGLLGPDAPVLRVYAPRGVRDLGTPRENELMAELLYRLALAAREGGGPVLCSLAGGRKTMSSLLQKAASTFGAERVFHVLFSGEGGRGADPEPERLFREGLTEEEARGIHPVDLGSEEPFEGVEWNVADVRPLRAADYPVPDAGHGPGPRAVDLREPCLYREVEGRRREAGRIARNYFFHILGADARENFRSLYRLPAGEIERLREERIGLDAGQAARDLAWLRHLPKAELHCHLGGVAGPAELSEIAAAVAAEAGPAFDEARERVRGLVEWFGATPPGPASLESAQARFRDVTDAGAVPGHWAAAAVIEALQGNPDWLDALTWPETVRVWSGLPPLEAYFAAGTLQGSALLQSRGAIGAACRVLVRKAAEDNVRYLEVRCSPAKYARQGLSPAGALEAIRQGFSAACARVQDPPRVELLIIGTRHSEHGELSTHIKLAAGEPAAGPGPRVLGFDLAGREATRSPAEVRELFLPLFQRCLKITIHAGETEPVESVWEAVYHLNADRIGHGLKLLDKPELLAHFRDRGTAVELCPTSNDQVVGFRDSWREGAGALREYPLRRYLDEGLRVCVCTDNPGISRTTWSRELLKAARLTPGGLTRWDVLSIVRAGFQGAFLPQPERAEMLREADRQVYEALGPGGPGQEPGEGRR